MKHAFLIIAHNEYPVLEVLLSMLDDERNDIYLHIDKRATELFQQIKKVKMQKAGFYLIENPIKVYWYNPQIQISVVSGTKRSIFRQKNKTKRSKKRLHTTLIKPEQKVNEDLCSGFIVS